RTSRGRDGARVPAALDVPLRGVPAGERHRTAAARQHLRGAAQGLDADLGDRRRRHGVRRPADQSVLLHPLRAVHGGGRDPDRARRRLLAARDRRRARPPPAVSLLHVSLIAYSFRWSVIRESFGELEHGVKITLELSCFSLALSVALGLVVALCRLAPFAPLRLAAYVYVQIFRAVSLYIYVLWIYFGLAGATGINLSPLTAGVIALTVLNSAYMAEIYRSALGAVDPGQHEAATSLGFGRIRGFSTV